MIYFTLRATNYPMSTKLPIVKVPTIDVSVTISLIEYQHTFGFAVLTFSLHVQVSRVNSKLQITTLHY